MDISRFEVALRTLWPRADKHINGLTKAMAVQAPALFDLYGIDLMACCNMMGEFTEECGGGVEVSENLDYRASVLRAQWPNHFTQEQAVAMAHHPVQIACQAYNGRMGNVPGSMDGWSYRGRGPSQITGRDSYAKISDLLKVDFVKEPDLVNTPEYFLEVGVADFVTVCGCLPYAIRDQEVNETRHLNGGLIGLAQRQTAIRLWKDHMGVK